MNEITDYLIAMLKQFPADTIITAKLLIELIELSKEDRIKNIRTLTQDT